MKNSVCGMRFGAVCVVAVAVASAGRVASAAAISFANPVAITSDSVLDQPGTIVHAGLFGPGPITVITPAATAINFQVTPGTTDLMATGTTTQMFGTYAYQPLDENVFDNDPPIVSNAFDNVLDIFSFGPTLENPYGTLRLGGLTIGRDYAIQLLSADDRGGGHTVQFADNTDRSGATGNVSVRFLPSTNPSIIGTFTADAVFQDVFVFGFANGSDATINGFAQTLNAYVLLDVTPAPEPASGTMLLLGSLVLAQFRLRMRRKRAC
jgi:hypothetical protein